MMKPIKTVVIDYGLGNLYSVKRALEVCGALDVCISNSERDISNADRLVLPGVGAFADGIKGLGDRKLIDPIRSYAESGRPLLGICLGMQMLTTASEEFGYHEGLNLIPGYVRAIPSYATDGSELKIPHIGWSPLIMPSLTGWHDSILSTTPEGSSVYLVHSYAVETESPSHLLSYCEYGGHKISSVIRKNEIYGCQFHPEKSGDVGLGILSRFIKGAL
jgi:imidazole glycerol-phosphate synthase subunit HisH